MKKRKATRPTYWRECVRCTTRFLSTDKDARFCSEFCGETHEQKTRLLVERASSRES